MAPKKVIKAEKPALTLNFDKEAADDLEYIANLVGQDAGSTVSLALGVLKKIAEERSQGHRTYIEVGSRLKEEILVHSSDENIKRMVDRRVKVISDAEEKWNRNKEMDELKQRLERIESLLSAKKKPKEQ